MIFTGTAGAKETHIASSTLSNLGSIAMQLDSHFPGFASSEPVSIPSPELSSQHRPISRRKTAVAMLPPLVP